MDGSLSATPSTLPADGQAQVAGHSLTRFTNWIVGAYLAFALIVMLVLRVTPSVDLFFVFAVILAVLLGRGLSFVRDWGPFVLIFFAWEGMRGIANQFGQAVISDGIIGVERALMFGSVPTVTLQQALRVPGEITPLDIGLTFVYISHFFFPLALAFFFWLRHREMYYRFVTTLMLVSFAAFFTFIVMPVAPPRFAWYFGQDLGVADVMEQVFAQVEWGGFNWVYANMVGNPVAAFPSMHAAYPLLVLLFLAERWRAAAAAWSVVTVTIWFATIYLGHHYVVDVLGGAIYAVVGYLLLRHSSIGSWLAHTYARAFRRAARDVARLVPARR